MTIISLTTERHSSIFGLGWSSLGHFVLLLFEAGGIRKKKNRNNALSSWCDLTAASNLGTYIQVTKSNIKCWQKYSYNGKIEVGPTCT